MNYGITKLKTLLQSGQGLVKPYEFQINILKEPWFDLETTRRFSDLVQDFSLPAKTYSKQPVYYGGPLRNFPYVSTFPGEINFTVLLRKKDKVFDSIHGWHEAVISNADNLVQFQDDYVAKEIEISIRTKTKLKNDFEMESSPITYKLFDVWPESLTEIQMTNTAQNDYVRYSVSFSYRKWTTIRSTNVGIGSIDDPTSSFNAGSDFNPDFIQ